MSKSRNTLQKQQKKQAKRLARAARTKKILTVSLISVGSVALICAIVFLSIYLYQHDTTRPVNQFELTQLDDGTYEVNGIKEGYTPKGKISVPSEIDGMVITRIGLSAFENQSEITEVSLPDTITYIGDCAFQSCTSLQSIVFPKNLTGIGNLAFQGCSSLISINFTGQSLKTIGDSAFNTCVKLEAVTLPEGLESIGSNSFSDCSAIRSFKTPSTLTTIGRFALKGCVGLNEAKDSLVLSSSIISVGEFAFSGIYRSSISIPEDFSVTLSGIHGIID